MPSPDTDMFYLRSGVMTTPEHITILAGARELDSQDLPNTFVFTRHADQDWQAALYEWSSVAISCTAAEHQPGALIVGEDGDYLQISPLGDVIFQGKIKGAIPRTVTRLGSDEFMAGMGGDLFRHDAADQWHKIPTVPGDSISFEALCGHSGDDFYAVGWNGLIARHRSDSTQLIEPLTNVILTSACMTSTGKVYACGQNGVIISGEDDTWQVICEGETNEDLWSIVCFQNDIYLSSIMCLYKIRDDSLEKVDFSGQPVGSCFDLSVLHDEILLSVGREDVLSFDGNAWERII